MTSRQLPLNRPTGARHTGHAPARRRVAVARRWPARLFGDRWLPVSAFTAVAGAVILLSQVAYAVLDPAVYRIPVPQVPLPEHLSWLGAWTWWDGAWYATIAQRGYTYTAGPQSPVAFFPAYPLLMRGLSGVVGHPALAGFLVTLASGLAAAVLFHRWCLDRLDRGRAALAVGLLLLYPCSFYLTGAVYADALFVASTLGAFVLLERDRTLAAGLLGAVATASRPIGVAVVVGLWLRAREQRRADALEAPAGSARRRPRGFGLLLAPAGLVAYATFLAVRFGNPLAFIAAERAWGQEPGWETWLKVTWFERMLSPPFFHAIRYHLIGSALLTVLAILLLPRVYRRFGPAYGVFATLVVVGTALSTKDFTGMGRYVLAAFPVFAAAADRLAVAPRHARAVLVGFGLLLAVLAQLHARNMLIS